MKIRWLGPKLMRMPQKTVQLEHVRHHGTLELYLIDILAFMMMQDISTASRLGDVPIGWAGSSPNAV